MAPFEDWIRGIGRSTRLRRSETYPVPVGELERIVRAAARRSPDLRVYELGPEGGTLYQRTFVAYSAGTIDLQFLAEGDGSRVDATSHLSSWTLGYEESGREARTLDRLFRDLAAVIADDATP